MGLFDKYKEKKQPAPPVDFTQVDSNEKAEELAKQGILYPLYCMPLRFNGEESARNRVYVPKIVVELKDRYDDMVESLLRQDRVNGYSCTPRYKGRSFVPSEITVVAKKNGEPVFTETIHVW